MAKTTLASDNYKIQDIAGGTDRKLLSYRKDRDEIYYAALVDSEPQPEAAPLTESKVITVSEPTPATHTVVASTEDVKIPDVPPASIDALNCLVALALRKPIPETSQSQSIKTLCGGMQ